MHPGHNATGHGTMSGVVFVCDILSRGISPVHQTVPPGSGSPHGPILIIAQILLNLFTVRVNNYSLSMFSILVFVTSKDRKPRMILRITDKTFFSPTIMPVPRRRHRSSRSFQLRRSNETTELCALWRII